MLTDYYRARIERESDCCQGISIGNRGEAGEGSKWNRSASNRLVWDSDSATSFSVTYPFQQVLEPKLVEGLPWVVEGMPYFPEDSQARFLLTETPIGPKASLDSDD